MIKKNIFYFCVLLMCITSSYASSCDKSDHVFCCSECQDKITEVSATNEDKYDMSIVSLLGVVQGVTEFLPVSSTGHMILVEHYLNKKSAVNISRGDAMRSYFAIIQCGSILAIMMLYRKRIFDMILACCFKSRGGGFLIRNLLLSFLPAGILGLMLDGILQKALYNPSCIACALILGAFLIFYVEKKIRKFGRKKGKYRGIKRVRLC